MAGMSPNGQDIIVNAYIQRFFRHTWQVGQYHQTIPRLIDIDRRCDITLLMARTLCHIRLLDLWSRNGFLCHGIISFFILTCQGVRLAYLHGNLFGFCLFCLRERHNEQSVFIIGMDFVLVHFHG